MTALSPLSACVFVFCVLFFFFLNPTGSQSRKKYAKNSNRKDMLETQRLSQRTRSSVHEAGWGPPRSLALKFTPWWIHNQTLQFNLNMLLWFKHTKPIITGISMTPFIKVHANADFISLPTDRLNDTSYFKYSHLSLHQP